MSLGPQRGTKKEKRRAFSVSAFLREKSRQPSPSRPRVRRSVGLALRRSAAQGFHLGKGRETWRDQLLETAQKKPSLSSRKGRRRKKFSKLKPPLAAKDRSRAVRQEKHSSTLQSSSMAVLVGGTVSTWKGGGKRSRGGNCTLTIRIVSKKRVRRHRGRPPKKKKRNASSEEEKEEGRGGGKKGVFAYQEGGFEADSPSKRLEERVDPRRRGRRGDIVQPKVIDP